MPSWFATILLLFQLSRSAIFHGMNLLGQHIGLGNKWSIDLESVDLNLGSSHPFLRRFDGFNSSKHIAVAVGIVRLRLKNLGLIALFWFVESFFIIDHFDPLLNHYFLNVLVNFLEKVLRRFFFELRRAIHKLWESSLNPRWRFVMHDLLFLGLEASDRAVSFG